MNGPTEIHRVVLVVLDGLRPDAVDAFGLSNIARMASRGASTFDARTVTPSVTAAAMASLFTGVSPSQHGVVSDRFHIPRRRGPVDFIPRVLAAAGYPTVAFIGAVPPLYRGLAQRIARHTGIERVRCVGDGAQQILDAARPALATLRRGLIVLHWPDADRAGHEHGWMTRAYAEGSRALDSALGALFDMLALQDDPSTLLIALADHGGGGVVPTDHDSTHAVDQTIPIMLSGAAVASAQLMPPVTLLDVPPTVLWALGVPQPATYEGRPLTQHLLLARTRTTAAA